MKIKFQRHGVIRNPAGDSVSFVRKDHARDAAVEASYARYFMLECGHYGCREDDVLFSAWRPSRNLHYCELCGWSKLEKIERAQTPDTPLF